MNPIADPFQFSPSDMESAVSPMLFHALSPETYVLLARYLQLLTHWNKKINLTAVLDPEILVRLHLAECLRAAQRIPEDVETVLDFGSGAGFPGIPIQIARPELRVTLAESQKKKAAFLREVLRDLDLHGASVQAGRVEDMPQSSLFDLVALRAVDRMTQAVQSALPRIRAIHGKCMVLTSRSEVSTVTSSIEPRTRAAGMEWAIPEPIPGTDQRVILMGSRVR